MSSCCHQQHTPASKRDGASGPYTCPMHPEIVQEMPGDCPLCGMALEPMGAPDPAADSAELRRMTWRLVIAALLSLPVFVLGMAHWAHGTTFAHWAEGTASHIIQAVLSGIVLFGCGWTFLRRGWQSLKNRSANMFTLIATGTLAAWGFSMVVMLWPTAFHAEGVYFEAAAVIITLVLAGQVMELRAMRKTGDALRSLMDLAPATAWKIATDGSLVEVPLEEIVAGDVLRVRPGGKVPVDGIVVAGGSTVDESLMTGEPWPVEVQVDSPVRAGTINGAGSFDLRAEAVGSDTLLAGIVELVAQAQRGRAPVQDLADRVASIFVPAVVAFAVIAFLAWIIFSGSLAAAMTAAVAVLIIACPCAIGLAVPMSIMVGVGRAARNGVLVRQPAALEALEKTDTLCLDKTGTLTEGRPEVVDIVVASSSNEERLLTVAASLEAHSEHPLAAAIVRVAQERGLTLLPVNEFVSTVGGGVQGTLDGKMIKVGTPEFTGAPTTTVEKQNHGRTRVDVAENGQWMGSLFLDDKIKPSAVIALETLRKSGLRVVMLTGDRQDVARRVAGELGITEYQSALNPQGKVEVIRKMQDEGRKVCMTGDGVNDAPALAIADTSIAMGAGSDVAKESADFILVHGSLDGIVRTFALGRAIMRNIRQNLFLAFAYNVLGIPLAAGALYPLTGWLLSPMIAGAAMSLSSVSVITNALRLRKFKQSH